MRERDAVDPLPAGGVRGQRVGVQQRGDRARIHVLLPAVHVTVSASDGDVHFHPRSVIMLCLAVNRIV